tara:strand:- start:64 stop:261 length:198 start_codon:yes stop_codon:yes gene_type:complete
LLVGEDVWVLVNEVFPHNQAFTLAPKVFVRDPPPSYLEWREAIGAEKGREDVVVPHVSPKFEEQL